MGTKTRELEYLMLIKKCFHSINVPSEWGPYPYPPTSPNLRSFHSINVPSEWGQLSRRAMKAIKKVSIQLMSPASGDQVQLYVTDVDKQRFHSINVPSEWGPIERNKINSNRNPVSIQLMSPASGDVYNR